MSTTVRPEARRKSGDRFKDFFDTNAFEFAAKSRLPLGFFQDLKTLQDHMEELREDPHQEDALEPQTQLEEQMRLLNSVRKLEDKLAQMKIKLAESTKKISRPVNQSSPTTEVVLTKDDYTSLVDLYYYTHHKRFDPETPDSSPTPMLLEDYAFKLSEDFAPPQAFAEFYNEDEDYRSPLKEIEERILSRQLREVSVTQVFVDLLLDDTSSNAALFRAYRRLPQPGMAFLPRGIVRLFLQRMSTPWQKSEKSMIRYLSLIDDAQRADVPVTRSEWASAIYLAGRSFNKVTQAEVDSAFHLWRRMENDAGVKAHHVTFNILFDIAVRAGKFPLAQMVLKEMHDRGFRLNRLGRVSVIYYHGLRGDGDAVRKAYRDFVDAGEIIDTLVLNCVIASLYNAQEPTAAEQIYERMKSLQENLRREKRDGGHGMLYRRYPGPGGEVIEHELAANHLNRILVNASRLKNQFPENHQQLQDAMPLTPDHITFRAMISYHINVSGNLHRVTVLLEEMNTLFNLPLQSITFQLLFKGFALHGATRDPDASWSQARLDMVWNTCREAMKAGQAARRGKISTDVEPTLPTARAVELGSETSSTDQTGGQGSSQSVGFKKLSSWNEFVLDLAIFPRERRKHIERIHAELFDEEMEEKKSLFKSSSKQSPPQGQEMYYPLGGDAKLDQEEGEYVLPSPSEVIDPAFEQRHKYESSLFPEDFTQQMNNEEADTSLNPGQEPHPTQPESNVDHHAQAQEQAQELEQDQDQDQQEKDEDSRDARPIPVTSRHQVQPTRTLICWLLRAYTVCYGDRRKVEEVWRSVRKLWKTPDQHDRDNVARVLRRCLRDCDRYGPPL
ncbi:hypothetical protein LTR47_005122 [Exophiala xenobiotica]|nr:hypothetical protein LTR47_005122 [Exophiala xenobiotica]KAK5250644.1 hypothetical protein LTS06_004528 [Exophiala xenobiotica]KAK5353304.1 hypothetical protein LTR61_003262 [Exophiala xenobiotica]KAK5380085.1 hypothetical protein LTR11_003714 [Exophiala xenobiotica]KAK5390855.1 hypothetical protein LTS03_000225 [Exophiala xenobiotica]